MATLPSKSTYRARTDIDLTGSRALVITTSHGTLDAIDPATGEVVKRGRGTGVYASEMTEPYYVFLDAGMDVDVASVKGGAIPIEALSLRPVVRTADDERFLKDPSFQTKAQESLAIADLDFHDYDVIFLAGGWGASYDLAQSDILSEKLSQAYAAEKVLGGVCHGPLGFIGAVKPDGRPLVEGVKMTSVTNRQVSQLRIKRTPKHPETELRKAGADYRNNSSRLVELFNDHVVVDEEHRIVTAQNQKGGTEAADRALTLLISIREAGRTPRQV
ncbi:type 1 glutamine amidotransferase domain-containing protein [Aeromicrobium sp. A1-2]|uniref:type 1 glutamine amidotransferase domain-containing protein n=1 Tax=Aeromicrobium sp. A1-2 TaxID=2107713 RepID=UPI000E47BB1C|nr:type 1 glutamine amidotransferase domain-containing protein [Aeromicrobium sp. A1-2]AXT85181.1 type 1 glutamine amidotransferase domain-containing protein [Aeromicrobium sp. A1-2]